MNIKERFYENLQEQREQLNELKKSTAIDAYRKRQSRADDFYSEPGDEDKAKKTRSHIEKKFGAKVAADADHGVKIDREGRKGHQGGSGDYLAAKQDVFAKFSRPKSKKGTKQRLDYMRLNKGRFVKEEEQLDELTKKTMRSYKHKAAADRVNNSSDNKIVNKRTKGINLALSRLSKKSKFDLEEEQQLDEIKKLKKRYVKQARKQGNVFFDPPKTSLGALSTKSGNKYEKRLKYVEKAEKSLREAEQLDTKKKSDKKDKLFLRSRKMIAVSKLDRNRKRNKDNRQD